ncbi:hypothetical protein ACFPRL_14325 [Pseudoclavibacter helvolus]
MAVTSWLRRGSRARLGTPASGAPLLSSRSLTLRTVAPRWRRN